MKRALTVLIGLALASCDAGVFEQPFKQPPQITRVIVEVVWHDDIDKLRAVCGNARSYACATVGSVVRPISTIHSMRPRSFNHAPIVEALGHELLHALGATHGD